MVDVLFGVCGVTCLVAAGYKVRDLRQSRGNRPQRALTVGLFFLGFGFLSAAPVVYTTMDRLIGIPNGMRLVSHICIVLFSGAIAQMLLHWAYPPRLAAPRGRRRLAGYAGTTTTLTVLFAAAPVDEEAVEWTIRYGDHPLVACYLLLYIAAFAVAMAEIARLSHRYAGFLPFGAMRVGLRLTTVGASFGLAYCVYKALYLAGRQMGSHAPDPADWLGRDDIIAPILAVPGGVLVVIGLTLPSWGPPIGRAWSRVGQYRAYRDLYPLWKDLYDAEPDILFDERVPPAHPWRSVDALLERRAIEIPDGILRLTPFCDPAVERQATAVAERARLTGDRRLAVIQGVCVAAAIQSKTAGHRAVAPAAPRSAEATTMEEQIAWLRLVGRAYRRHRPNIAIRPENAHLAIR